MNPSEKGWLRKFITFKKRRLRSIEANETLSGIANALSSQESLYRMIQPTGLMYGYPIRFIGKAHIRAKDWSEKDKIKVLLAECYLICGLFFHYDPEKELTKAFNGVVEDIRDFYQQHQSLFSTSARSLFGRRKHVVDQIEYILDKRISIKYDWRNFWSSFFHNSLLFFDLIFFVQWMESDKKELADAELKRKRLTLRMDILKIISAAAHADEKVQPEERELFNYFLQSANLPAGQKRKAASIIKKPIKLEELNLGAFDSWILKKYYLELALLTTWSNRTITKEEKVFLRKLAHQLDLSEGEMLHSTDAVKDFVLEYWEQVHYLQIKQNYRIVSEQMLKRMRIVVRKNQRNIALEIRESRELVVLLRKSTRTELTIREKEKVREQLLDILKAIPAFAFFFLPGSFLTLPILLRIIPKSILYPSSFQDREDEGE